MNILVINTFYSPNMIGGTEHSVKILCENLVLSGNNVAVYCIDSKKQTLEIEEINGVSVFRGNGGLYDVSIRMSKRFHFKKILNKLLEFNNTTIRDELDQVLELFQPDVVHTNNINGISPFIWKIFNKKNIPIIHTLRDYYLLSPKYDLPFEDKKNFSRYFYLAYQAMMMRNTGKVQYVTGPSKFIVQKFSEYGYFENVEKKDIANCVNIDFNDMKSIINLKKSRNSNEINYLFVGLLNHLKGIDMLLEIFHKSKHENIRLTICGSGPLEKLVKQYCEMDDRISYTGQLSTSELNVQYDLSDVLIIPSLWDEPFGRVVIEANLHGNLVIGSNKGGIPEIMNHMNAGRVYDVKDNNTLLEAIEIYSKRSTIKQQLDNIIENIEEYSSDLQTRRFLEIYKYVK